MRKSLREYCSQYEKQDLLEQWHPEKNGTLTPDDVSFGSHQKVWWRCPQNHIWESPVYARTGKDGGCPYCAGKKVMPGEDFQTLHPELARQWHPTKNGQALPSQYLPGSHKSAWWVCETGHTWKAMIKTRVEGSGCPVCSNRSVIPGINDLKTMAPTLAQQWHPTKNGDLKPDEVSPGSTRKVWWLCSRGHEWQAEIHSRTAGKGCPVCSGRIVVPGENDLESYAPELAKQWHPEKNGLLRPSQVAIHSNRQVWWICEKQHAWQAAVSSRTFNHSGCPYCAGRKVLPGFNDLATLQPKVAAQWHPTLNDQLEPSMVMPGSTKRVWWKCSDGHVWKAIIYSRTGTQMCGCPVCAGRTPKRYG